MRKGCFTLAALFAALAAGASFLVMDARAFVGHMSVHMALVAVCAPLLAASISGTTFDVSRNWQAPSAVLLSLIELVVIWIWHLPAMRQAAEVSAAVRAVELVTFVVAGTLLWLACLNVGPRRGMPLAGIVALLLTSMHMTILGVLLTMAPRALYGLGEVTCFGLSLSSLQDQQLGGVIMLLVGALVYLCGALFLLGRVLASTADGWQKRQI